jgi:hypothetical protein
MTTMCPFGSTDVFGLLVTVPSQRTVDVGPPAALAAGGGPDNVNPSTNAITTPRRSNFSLFISILLTDACLAFAAEPDSIVVQRA